MYMKTAGVIFYGKRKLNFLCEVFFPKIIIAVVI